MGTVVAVVYLLVFILIVFLAGISAGRSIERMNAREKRKVDDTPDLWSGE